MSPSVIRVDGSARAEYSYVSCIWLSAHRDPVVDVQALQCESVLVHLVKSRGRVVSVAMVPDELANCVTNLGLPLEPGLHPLRHADHLRIDGRSFWVSALADIEMSVYDPAKHGEDVRCIVSHARLSPGQPIAVCPGTAQTECGAIYLRESWQLIQQGEGPVKCPNCRFERPHSPWRPPPAQVANRLAGLLALLKKRGTDVE